MYIFRFIKLVRESGCKISFEKKKFEVVGWGNGILDFIFSFLLIFCKVILFNCNVGGCGWSGGFFLIFFEINLLNR